MTLAAPEPLADVYLPRPARVEEVTPLTDAEIFFRLRAEEPGMVHGLPGQFLEVTVPGIGEAPISISSSVTRRGHGGDDWTWEMVVRRAGNVTAAMHRLAPGDRIGLRGPFGTHFPVDSRETRGRDLLLIAGGLGLVPLRSAIQYVLDRRRDYGRVTILVGTRSPADRLFIGELAEWAEAPGVRVLETVDTASPDWDGHVGVITTLLPRVEVDNARTTAILCGPPIMYKFVLLELHKLGLPDARIWMSLERHMKCAVGKCGHCQINGRYACQDGPVYRYLDIARTPEAIG